MANRDREYGAADLILWIMVGTVVTFVLYSIFVIAQKQAGETAIAVLSAFGAGMSALTSIVLVGIYIEQTRIFDRHGKILQNQTDLMELQFIPDVRPTDNPKITGNQVEISLENKGPGDATNLELITRIEFEESNDYESPLIGSTDLGRIEDNHTGESYLLSGESGSFSGECLLEVSALSGEKKARSFENIVSNLSQNVEKIRISLSVEISGKRGKPQQVSILPEEAFYTNLEDLDEYTVSECRRVSNPA